MSRQFTVWRIAGGAGLALMCVFVIGAGEPTQLSWRDIGHQVRIYGALGKPLGTYVIVEGTRPVRPMMLANPLAVDAIDGKKLAEPVMIEVQGDAKFQDGVRYILRGYETGGMSGHPDDPEKPNGPVAQQPYHFSVWFESVTVLAPKAEGSNR